MIQFLLGIVAGAGLFAAKVAHDQEAQADRSQMARAQGTALPRRRRPRTPVDAHYDAATMATLERWVADLASGADGLDHVELASYAPGALPSEHVDRYGQVIVCEHPAIGGSGFVRVKSISGVRSQLRRVRAALATKDEEPLVLRVCQALETELAQLDQVDVLGGHWPPSL